jgi:Tol biopolymer transport system component
MTHRTRLLVAAIASSTIGLATLAAAAPAQAAFPGHNGKLVFLRTVQGSGIDDLGANEIFTSRRNGTHLKQLTHKRENDHPRWSPNGHRILYTHMSAKGPQQIWVMGAHGRNRTRLPGQGRSNNSEAAWAPDGHRIVFTQFTPGSVDLVVYSLRTHQLTPLHAGSGFDRIPSGPAWAPDGKLIAFAAINKGATNTTGDIQSELFVIQPDGAGLSQITHSLHFAEQAPNWSPDSRRLTYARNGGKKPGSYCEQLDTIRADGTNRHRVHAGCTAGWPSWSPNGRKIIANRSAPVQPGLWRMSPNGRHQHFIVLGFDADQQPVL